MANLKESKPPEPFTDLELAMWFDLYHHILEHGYPDNRRDNFARALVTINKLSSKKFHA